MKFTINGVEIETDDVGEQDKILGMLGLSVSASERIRDELARVQGQPLRELDPRTAPGPETREWLRDANGEATMPHAEKSAVAVLDEPVEKIIMPVDHPMPAKITVPPTVYVTQAQKLVVELLRHHPLGLDTKGIAEHLRWEHTKASRVTTYLVRNESALAQPIVAKVPGHKRYVITDFGRKCRFQVVRQPALYRANR